MDLSSGKALLLHELQEVYDMEQQALDGLSDMANAATNEELKEAFEQHHKETQEQIKRLEQVFEEMGEKPKTSHSKVTHALVKEAEQLIEADGEPVVKDAAMIVAAQCTEHVEIAKYGAARTHAEQMGFDKVADLLEKTLNEEKATDKKLNKIAMGKTQSEGVNKQAAHAS